MPLIFLYILVFPVKGERPCILTTASDSSGSDKPEHPRTPTGTLESDKQRTRDSRLPAGHSASKAAAAEPHAISSPQWKGVISSPCKSSRSATNYFRKWSHRPTCSYWKHRMIRCNKLEQYLHLIFSKDWQDKTLTQRINETPLLKWHSVPRKQLSEKYASEQEVVLLPFQTLVFLGCTKGRRSDCRDSPKLLGFPKLADLD